MSIESLKSPIPSDPLQHHATPCNTSPPVVTDLPTPELQLTDLQTRALDLLLQGLSDSEVARQLSIDRSTIWRWKRHDAGFRAALHHLRADRWSAAADRYHRLLDRASAIFEQAFDSPMYLADKVKVAQSLLCMAAQFKPHAPPPPPTTPNGLPTKNPRQLTTDH